jgi:sugar phosphate isomerase/epimerase
MELGISDLGHLIDASTNPNAKIENLLMSSARSCLDFAEQNSIKVVELIIDTSFFWDTASIEEYVKMVNSYSLKKQVHAPFMDSNMCSHNEDILNASIKANIEAINIALKIAAECVTIHPGYANFILPAVRMYNLRQLKKSMKALLKYATNENIHICIENMPLPANIMSNENNIQKVLTVIDVDDLFMTYDTSHFFMNDGDVEKLWYYYNSKIKNIHIVDNFTRNFDPHPRIGSGVIDLKRQIEIFKKYNYDGSLIIELCSASDLNESIIYMQKLL